MARFNALVHFSGWYCEALSHNFEVMDQRFHLRLHLFAIRQHNLGRIGLDRSAGHSIQRLLIDLYALALLFMPDNVTRPAVSHRRSGHLELKLLVAAVRHVAADIEIDARSTHDRPSHGESDGVRSRNIADAFE